MADGRLAFATCGWVGESWRKAKEFVLCSGGKSLSAVFTQTRLLRPECVSSGILMLTYLSTLRSKSRRFLFRPQNAYFANSPNTSHRLRYAPASLRKATPRPSPDSEQVFLTRNISSGLWLNDNWHPVDEVKLSGMLVLEFDFLQVCDAQIS